MEFAGSLKLIDALAVEDVPSWNGSWSTSYNLFDDFAGPLVAAVFPLLLVPPIMLKRGSGSDVAG